VTAVAPQISGPSDLSARADHRLRVTQLRVLRSEWTKFRSLRSTAWTMLMAVTFMIGLGALFSATTANSAAGLDPGSTASSVSLTGTFFAQLAIGVLGALMITGEYGTGMIRASLTVVPKRLPMLWAKLTVLAAAVFSTMLITSLTAFLLGQALLSGKHLNVALSNPTALRSVFGAALYLTAMIGLALGALLRNTAAAITTFVAVFFVIPTIASLLPATWTSHFVQYLPSNAGTGLIDGTYGLANPLAPWTGFAVMCAFLAALIGLAAWRLQRTDA
jgi:ABC-2 type transport system permease protein